MATSEIADRTDLAERADHRRERAGDFASARPQWHLLADAELTNQLRIAVGVLALQVVKQTATLAYELEEASPGVMILDVGFEVLRQVADAFAEERDLDFGGASI